MSNVGVLSFEATKSYIKGFFCGHDLARCLFHDSVLPALARTGGGARILPAGLAVRKGSTRPLFLRIARVRIFEEIAIAAPVDSVVGADLHVASPRHRHELDQAVGPRHRDQAVPAPVT